MKRVIFPSARLVSSELQSVGRLPAIVYPINQKNMITLFKEHYLVPGGADTLEIVTYDAYDKVYGRIEQTESIHLWKLDTKKDIGYTVWWGLSKSGITDDDAIIINFADVIVFEDITGIWDDRCYYAEEKISSKWTFFEDKHGEITTIYDQLEDVREINSNRMFIGLFYIAHVRVFYEILEHLLKLDHRGNIDSLYLALREYSRRFPFSMKKPEEWFDIGHLDKYYDAQLAIKSRTFNHIVIDRNRGILTKRSDNQEKLINEIKWYLKLPKDIEYIRPRIFDYSLAYDAPYVSMEYYAYHTLHELFLYGDLSEEQWLKIFQRIKFILRDMGRYTAGTVNIKSSLEAMYMKKTLARIEAFRKYCTELINFERPLTINNKRYISFNKILSMLPKIIRDMLMDVDDFCIVHGDLCFTNILIDPNYSFLKCIDPRGSFGDYDIYGDQRYELAKLLHSVEGKYDYIIKDLFSIKSEGNIIEYQVIEQKQTCSVQEVFYSSFENDMAGRKSEIRLIESLLFFSMIPLHSESKKRQMAMLATGIQLLGNIIDISEG